MMGYKNYRFSFGKGSLEIGFLQLLNDQSQNFKVITSKIVERNDHAQMSSWYLLIHY